MNRIYCRSLCMEELSFIPTTQRPVHRSITDLQMKGDRSFYCMSLLHYLQVLQMHGFIRTKYFLPSFLHKGWIQCLLKEEELASHLRPGHLPDSGVFHIWNIGLVFSETTLQAFELISTVFHFWVVGGKLLQTATNSFQLLITGWCSRTVASAEVTRSPHDFPPFSF